MHIPCIPNVASGERRARGQCKALGSQGLVANAWFRKTLAVSSDGTKFTGKEMIRWPRSADRYLAVFQLLCSGGIAVLIFFDALGIDQVSDVD